MATATPPLTGLTRDEAQEHARHLNRVQETLVRQIKAVGRKRSWRPSERAMARADLERTLLSITNLNEMLCQHYGIGGY